MDALYHARSAAKYWGGTPDEYLPIELWLDQTAAHVNDIRHRAILHNSFGVSLAVERFGRMLKLSTGKEVPVKQICERHVREDLGVIPTIADWLRTMPIVAWMRKGHYRKIIF